MNFNHSKLRKPQFKKLGFPILTFFCFLMLTNSAFAQASWSPGHVDSIDASGLVQGWSVDPGRTNRSVTLHFYVGGPAGQGQLVGSTVANGARPDVNRALNVQGQHGFQFRIPPRSVSQNTRVYVYALGVGGRNPQLHGVKQIAAGAPQAPNPSPTPSPAPPVSTGPLGDLVLRGKEITIGTTRSHGASVTRLDWNGKQFINNHDHGRQLQIAWTVDRWGEALNPTEAGSRSDGAGNTSTTQVLAGTVRGKTLETSVHPSYWLQPGQSSHHLLPGGQKDVARNTTLRSADILEKKIIVDYQNDPHLIRWETTIKLAQATGHIQLESPTPYVNAEFRSFYSVDLSRGTVTDLRATQSTAAGQFPAGSNVGEQNLPIILATSNGSHAIGIYSPERGARYGYFNFTAHHGTAKSNIVIRRDNLNAGSHRYISYIAVGTVQDVVASLQRAAGLRVQSPQPVTNPAPTTPTPPSGNKEDAIGFLDGINGGLAQGWALDPDLPQQSISIHVYANGPAGRGQLIGNLRANRARADVNRALGVSGRHGFAFMLPAKYHRGTHTLYFYAIDANGGKNPTLTGGRAVRIVAGSISP